MSFTVAKPKSSASAQPEKTFQAVSSDDNFYGPGVR